MRLLCGLALLVASIVAAQEQPVEVTVRGRQPGPPLWLVRNGENQLWIFARLSPVPKDMQWDSDKVAAVIAAADESIGRPDADVSLSPLTLLNPVNVVRGMRLAKRLSKNPGGETLQERLPPELYQRFSAIKAERLPRDKELETLRPVIVGRRLMDAVMEQEKLVSARAIDRQLERLLKRNRALKRTSVEVKVDIKGGYRQLAARAESFADSIAPELELACFEARLLRIERDVDAMKYRADSWARGYIDEFRGIPLPGDDEDPCLELAVSGSERELLQELREELNARWLQEAERALQQNRSTFAILNIADLLNQNGLLATLAAKGYQIEVP